MESRPDQGKEASLQDIVGYKVDSYLTDKEIGLIRSVFNGPQGREILQVIRKIMLPTILDPNMPIEEMGKDMFMAKVDFVQLSVEESKAISMGLQLTTKIVVGGLIQLKQLANVAEETKEEATARRLRNGTK